MSTCASRRGFTVSQERDIPPITGIGYHWQLQKAPLFWAFLRNLPALKYPPFQGKWEHACSPLMHSRGGGGAITIETWKTYIPCSLKFNSERNSQNQTEVLNAAF